ncbi:MAG TPA: tRNA pseudouridine synthase A [Anaerolineales bacterium]|nr:tRNA pseudouridine synthase A [Anaerolineales bacterium]
MARYKLILAYDGSAFAGSQRQASTARSRTGRRRTVQGDLEDALHSLGWQGRSVIMAGRTDSGANASGQVAAVDLDWPHKVASLRDALNARLPFEMVVREAELAEPKFHPRFDAKSRSYRYLLFCANLRDPLRERTAWRVRPELDAGLLAQTAPVFIGRRDFGAFGSAPAGIGNTVRTVLRAGWTEVQPGSLWQFDVTADAFLFRMVRRMVFVQVAVAQGRCSRDAVLKALDRGSTGKLPAGLAPAHGLELMRVDY